MIHGGVRLKARTGLTRAPLSGKIYLTTTRVQEDIMSPEIPAIVNIVDVVPEAQQVTAAELVKGDRLFDCFGRTSESMAITAILKMVSGRIRTRRADGYVDYWDATDTITIIRKG